VICLGLLPALRAQETEVTVVVDLSPEGQKLLHPSPQQPAYYLPVMLGFKEEDGAYAHSERPLPINQIARQVAETLAQQGYLVAHPSLKFNAKHEVVYADDTVLLVPSFPNPGRPLRFDQPRDYPLTADMLQSQDGTYSFSRPAARGEESLLPLAQVLRHIDPGHGAVLQGLPSLVLAIHVGNKHQASYGEIPISATGTSMVDLLAGDAFEDLSQPDKEEILKRIKMDRYFVVINAYDLSSLLQKKTVLLWSAKISAPSGASATFGKVLPVLLAVGGPHLGQATRTELFPIKMARGQVTIGVPRVIEDSSPAMNP